MKLTEVESIDQKHYATSVKLENYTVIKKLWYYLSKSIK